MKKNIFRILKLLFGCIGIALVLVGILIYQSYNWLQITNYEIESDKITNQVDICLLTDLHDHKFGKANSKLINAVASCSPDLILLCGDIINGYSDNVDTAFELAEQLISIAPVYYSMGNQEVDFLMNNSDSDFITRLEGMRIPVLEEEYESINIKGNDIILAGMYNYAFSVDDYGKFTKKYMKHDTLEFLESFSNHQPFKIMMAHRPDSFIFAKAYDNWKIDLVLSGHLHGGQVVFPFLGGLYAGDQGLFPQFDYGLYSFNGTGVDSMIISRGLGSGREKLPRFNNRPEIVMLHIK